MLDNGGALKLLIQWVEGQLNEFTHIAEVEGKAIDKRADVCGQYLALDKIEDILALW